MRARQRNNDKGYTKTRLYNIWQCMHQRCHNPKNKRYDQYGGRNIIVCEQWNRDNINGFDNFKTWSIDNGYNETLTIDRINIDEEYSPVNCRWVDMKTQARNRRSNLPVTVNGIDYNTLKEACEALGKEKDYGIIENRIHLYGMTVQEAFTKPTGTGSSKSVCVCANGIEYKSIKQACKALNLNYATVIEYKNKYSITTEEVIEYFLIKNKMKRSK